jgi:threonine dehydrogenase-like Zn-dependent dehydrogenase
MDACAICNSTDLKLLKGEFCPGPFPTVLGHESTGTVVEVGPQVANFRKGDRVFRPRLADEHVEGGRSTWGGFAEYGIVADKWAQDGVEYLHHADDYRAHDQQKLMLDVEPALATGMVTLMETLDYMRGCGAAPGKSVAIVGSGPVGQAFALFAKLLGAGPVVAFGRRAVHAERFGQVARADAYVWEGPYPNEVEQVLADGGFDIVVEAVGSRAALDKCLELVADAGAACCYGVAPGSEPYTDAQQSDPRMRSVAVMEGRAQKQLVEFVKRGDVRLEDWVTHTLPMTEYSRAFDMVAGGEATKMALVP